MAEQPSYLERRFNRRRWNGLLFLLITMGLVAAIWALLWTRDSSRVKREMDRYTREEVLTLARLLLYDLAVDDRMEELRFLDREMAAYESIIGRWEGRPDPRVADLMAEEPDLPDALLWELALERGVQIDLRDVTKARYSLYRASLEEMSGSIEEDLWARVTFSDHLRAVRILSDSGRIDIRAGDYPFPDIPVESTVMIEESGDDLLTVYLPLHVHARRWGWVWCVLNRALLTQVTDRLQGSLLVSQALLAVIMAAFLGLWLWMGMVVLRQLKRDVVDPVVFLARKMEAWEQEAPPIPPDRDETVWLTEAFGRLMERVHGLLRDRDEALDRVRSHQEQLLKAERLGLLERIGSGLSHELNNALNPAKLRLEEILLAGRAVEEEDVEALLDHLTSAQRILKDLAAGGRRPATGFRPVQREDWIDVALRLLEPQFKEGPEWSHSIPDDLPDVVGDPQALIQIVMNLVLNAREAALDRPGGGGAVEIRLSERNEMVVLEVEDNGPGVPADLRTKLFEPFVSTKIHGSGLGLFLVETQLKRMGGWVKLADTGEGRTLFEAGLKRHRG